ncbi:MAG: inositol monophosphatase [Verrucomicrobia bacterium]|nr:inositol monophosphatase [Verrucomicrobiota bacterium]MDA1065403.1 inositol monophosphatase [Verrucomicrobiota bacterium]
MTEFEKERIRELLCELGTAVRDHVISLRSTVEPEQLASVSGVSESDTIYLIDKFSEESLLEWFSNNWPDDLPIELIVEGLEDQAPVLFPSGYGLEDTLFKVVIDPIDGTRELMYDKRSAWVIAGVAPQKFGSNRVGDIEVAMITELPTSKQRISDQISGCKGCGRSGLVSLRLNLDSGEQSTFSLNPSSAKTLEHGVAGFVKFFPEAKELIARFETDLWKGLGYYGNSKSPVIFDDQYISTAGQMYELIVGHYRFFGDIRPEALSSIGVPGSLTCHPYDVGAGLLLTEAGCILESPWGGEVDAPIDTVAPVSWVGYANEELARIIKPVLRPLLEEYFPLSNKKGL